MFDPQRGTKSTSRRWTHREAFTRDKETIGPAEIKLWDRCQLAWADEYLSHNAKMLHWYLLVRMGPPEGVAYASVRRIARDLALSPRSVKRAIKELKDSGHYHYQARPKLRGIIEWKLKASYDEVQRAIEAYVAEQRASQSGATDAKLAAVSNRHRCQTDTSTGANLSSDRCQLGPQKEEEEREEEKDCMQSASPLGAMVPPDGGAVQGDARAAPDRTPTDIPGLNGGSAAAIAKLLQIAEIAGKPTTDITAARWLGKTVKQYPKTTLIGLDELLENVERGDPVTSLPKALDAYAKRAGQKGKGRVGNRRPTASSPAPVHQSFDEFLNEAVQQHPEDDFYKRAMAQHEAGEPGDELRELQEFYDDERK